MQKTESSVANMLFSVSELETAKARRLGAAGPWSVNVFIPIFPRRRELATETLTRKLTPADPSRGSRLRFIKLSPFSTGSFPIITPKKNMTPSVETLSLPSGADLPQATANVGLKPVKENPNLKAGAQAYDLAPPVFDNPYEERVYLKQRLALAFRIFSKFGMTTMDFQMHAGI